MGKSQFRSQEDWVREFRRMGAMWRHDGVSTRPHAVLPSGSHSDSFFNSRFIIAHEMLLRDVVSDLLALLREEIGLEDIDGVVGPAESGTKLAKFISEDIADCKQDDCFFISPTKSKSASGELSIVLSEEDLILVNGSTVLLCDDIYSRETDIHLIAKAILDAGGSVLPFVLTIANQSVYSENGGLQIISLIDGSVTIWNPEHCPLCQRGSKPVNPKSDWNKLVA